MDKVCSRLGKRPEPEGSINYTPNKKKKKKKSNRNKTKKTQKQAQMTYGVRNQNTGYPWGTEE